MFTNPFNRKYESGGSVQSKANSLVEKASKNSGVSVKELTNKMNEFSSDEAKGGAFAELIKSAASDEDTKERREAVASLKAMFKKSTKFADRGKFQDFVCKHGRGGSVDCGCDGIKVVRAAEGIDDIPTPKDSTVTDNGYVIYKPSVKEVAPNGESVIITYGHDPNGQWARRMEWANGGTSILGGYNNNGKWVSEGDVIYPTSEFAQAFLNPKVRMSKYSDRPQTKQEGGELTRRQALTGAQWAMGRGISPVSRDTARLAYINAKNALRNNSDLRGRDLRQAAREMISRPPQAPVPEMAQIDFNTLNNGTILSPIEDPQFIEEPMFTDEELNQMGDQAVNNAMSSLSRNTRNRGNNAIAGAVQHFATIAPSTVGAVNYGGYDTGKFGERVGNYLKAHGTELMAHPIYGTIKGLYNWFKKEDGGVIMGLDGLHLSRKQARELSGLNKGYNRGQFQLAMANADAALRDNTDLRGRELRQAKRTMVAGITPMERTVIMESSPAELEIPLPTAETISNLNPNLELPVRKVVTPTRTRKSSRVAKALDNTVTTSPSIVINYEGYRNPGQNFKDMWNHFTGLFKKEQGGQIEKTYY